MAATKKRKQKSHAYRIRKAYKVIDKMLKEHGKVRIVFQDWCHWDQAFREDSRRRVIEIDGSCKVAYKSNGYKKYSGYSTSCFWHHREKKTLKGTLMAMKKHDGNHIIPMEIHYGWFFMKKEKL